GGKHSPPGHQCRATQLNFVRCEFEKSKPSTPLSTYDPQCFYGTCCVISLWRRDAQKGLKSKQGRTRRCGDEPSASGIAAAKDGVRQIGRASCRERVWMAAGRGGRS